MKNKLGKKLILLCLLLITGCFTGCGKGGNKEYSAELNKVLNGSPETIDPQLCGDTLSAEVISYFTGTLYTYNTDRELCPGLAESREVSEDGCTYTYHLREGLKWSDGTPLTAEDFVYGFQRLADPTTGSGSVYYITDCCEVKNADEINAGELPVSELGVSAPDNRTFIVELESPCPYFDSLTTQCPLAPCSRAFRNSCGDSFATSPDTVLCCGPYILDRYEPLAAQIHFVKNPNYYNADSVAIEGLNLQVVANMQQAMMCYKAGSMDIVNVSGELAELAVDDPHLQVFDTAGTFFLDLDLRNNEALGNVNIRRALSKSLDRESVVKNVLRTGYSALTRINPPNFYLDTDGEDFAGDDDMYDEYLGYDPDKAREYWNKGLEELGVESITLEMMFYSSMQSVAEVFSNQMINNLPGLTVNLKPVSAKEYTRAKGAGEYEMLLYGWVADYADPTAFYMLYVSSACPVGYDNPDFDKLFSETGTETDTAKRNEMLHKLEDMLCEDVVCLPLFSTNSAFLIADGVTGMQLYPTGAVVVVTGLSKEVR